MNNNHNKNSSYYSNNHPKVKSFPSHNNATFSDFEISNGSFNLSHNFEVQFSNTNNYNHFKPNLESAADFFTDNTSQSSHSSSSSSKHRHHNSNLFIHRLGHQNNQNLIENHENQLAGFHSHSQSFSRGNASVSLNNNNLQSSNHQNSNNTNNNRFSQYTPPEQQQQQQAFFIINNQIRNQSTNSNMVDQGHLNFDFISSVPTLLNSDSSAGAVLQFEMESAHFSKQKRFADHAEAARFVIPSLPEPAAVVIQPSSTQHVFSHNTQHQNNNNNNCELLVNPFCPSTSPLKKALKEATTPLVVFSPHAANIRDSVNTYYKELPFSRATSNHHAQQLTPLKARKATPRRTRPSEGAVRGRESTPHVGETGGEMASNTLHAGVTPFKAVATPKNLMHTEAVASLDFGDEESDDDANSSSTEFLMLSPQRSNEKEEEDADDKEVRFVVTSAPSRSVRFAPYCSSVGLSSYLPSTSCSLKETKEQKELIRSESANSAVVQDVVSRLNQLDKNTAWEERRRAIRFRNGLYSNSGCFDYESGGMGDEAFNLFQTNM
eukprot:GDKJ01003873.1.p1 GENE.GDKJ01003873.1~~GDKJ01003873.1.p1  ORF type:complete len:572 (-),score=174.09 GDKJ01003873.1:34-1680(-)